MAYFLMHVFNMITYNQKTTLIHKQQFENCVSFSSFIIRNTGCVGADYPTVWLTDVQL